MPIVNVRHEGLHALRGISLVLVLLTHLSLPSTILRKIPQELVNPFYWGAELFLVLSGFLITESILAERVTSIKEFIIKRVFRIYPPLIIYSIVAFVVNWVVLSSIGITESNKFIVTDSGVFISRLVYLLTTLAYISNQDLGYHFAQMWSVVIEVQYYLIIACLVLPLFWRLGRSIFIVLYGVVLFSILIARILLIFQIALGNSFVQYLVNMNVDFIAAGGLVAVWRSRNTNHSIESSKRGFTRIARTFLGTCLILMFLPSPLGISNWRYINNIVILCASMYIFNLTLSLQTVNKNTLFRVLLYLGDISYSVYLYHFTIFVIIWWAVVLYAPSLFYKTLAYETIQVSGLLLAIVILARIFKLIERKSIALGNIFYKRIA